MSKIVKIPLNAIAELLDSISCENGDVDADIELITKIVYGWKLGTKEDKDKLANTLSVLSREL